MQAKNAAIIIGICVSVIWVTTIIVFLYYQNFEEELLSSLLGMRWNEIGDALAGIFAPLAFFWLVIAVFVQSSELKAQREELSLTREEMSLARVIKEEEVKEARQTADFIGKQTDILHREEIKNAFKFHDEQLEDLIELALIYMKRTKYVAIGMRFSQNADDNEITKLFDYEKMSSSEIAMSNFLYTRLFVADYLKKENWQENENFDISCDDVIAFAELQAILRSLIELESRLSPSGKITYQRYHLYRARDHLRFYDELIGLQMDDYAQLAKEAEEIKGKREYLFGYQPRQ
ncbi:MAG: hypothetical protein AAFR71_06345 [Pseudomonadota bacterium]